MRSVDVLVVGAGPAGLAIAGRLAAAGAGRVEVLDRETTAGGAPRIRRPRAGRRRAGAAERAGAVVRTGVTALGWSGPLALDTVGAGGHETITARAVVLATGARERPRTAQLVAGTRPAGVYTTGELLRAVHGYGQRIGERAVVVGAEGVSYLAVATLRTAGVAVTAMVTDLPRHQASAVRAAETRLRRMIPLLTDATVTELLGHGRLSGVRLRHRDGRTTTLACDTVVFTGDFVPDQELARRGGLALDPGTRGPAVDGAFRTSREGVFAVGNVLHAVESADAVTREGEHAARHVRDHLAGEPWPSTLPVLVEPPLRWIAPNRLAPADACGFVLRTTEVLPRPLLTVTQDGRVLHRQELPGTAVPNRPVYVVGHWVVSVDPLGGPVRVTARRG
ncbi:oxidoreductase [Streptomyces hygroscopicus]|uniref:NAD(P)/FAD-dependent oxidoreductase n=1 Tax=Streptomyces hygroscopicus TaxID=1912 RepID=UPI00223F4F3B|nr:FAD-dependent oxidoreductase [Streptomyces hygroscopicus]MCW7946053.1 oxidoreductase [Streptomyces hygroscopicus]